MDTILVVNAGSSSVKFQVFETSGTSDLTRLIKGQMDGIGTRPRLRAAAADGTVLIDEAYARERVADVAAALATAGAWLREKQNLAPAAVGHRVVLEKLRDWLPIRRKQCAKRVLRKSRWSQSWCGRAASPGLPNERRHSRPRVRRVHRVVFDHRMRRRSSSSTR